MLVYIPRCSYWSNPRCIVDVESRHYPSPGSMCSSVYLHASTTYLEQALETCLLLLLYYCYLLINTQTTSKTHKHTQKAVLRRRLVPVRLMTRTVTDEELERHRRKQPLHPRLDRGNHSKPLGRSHGEEAHDSIRSLMGQRD